MLHAMACEDAVRWLLRDPRIISGIRNLDKKNALDLAKSRNNQHIIYLFDLLIARKRAPIAIVPIKIRTFSSLAMGACFKNRKAL